MIIQKLLLLETEAKEAMRNLEKEQAYMAKKADEELTRRLHVIQLERDAEITRLEQVAEQEVANGMTKIQAEYQIKENTLVTAFANNRNTWKDEIVNTVLYDYEKYLD